MTKLQNAALLRLQALVLFLQKKEIIAIIAAFLKLKDKVAFFIAAVTKIEDAIPNSGIVTKDTTGATQTRNDNIDTAVKLFKAALKVGKSWGKTSEIKEIKSLFSIKSTAYKTSQLNILALLENGLKVIKDNRKLIKDNTDITDKTIDILIASVAKASSHKGELRNEQVANKLKTKELANLFKDAQKALTSMTDSVDGLFAPELPDANAAFYDAYTELAELATTNRDTGVKALCLDGSNGNSLLGGVQLEIKSINKSALSNEDDAIALLVKLRAKNDVVLTFSKNGYKTVIKTVNITRGRVLKITVVMEKEG